MMPEAEELEKQEAELAALNEELRLDLAQAAIDVAGIADPTPISDVTGAALSLYRGDLIGAGLSLISVIPYAGDALAKTTKGARLAKKISSIKKKIEATAGRIAKLKKRGKKVDGELPASAKAKDAKSKGDDAATGSKNVECSKPGTKDSSPKESIGRRRQNRIPDVGPPNSVLSNSSGTTIKRYGSDGRVQKEYNKAHQGKKVPEEEQVDHVHDYIPKQNPHPKDPFPFERQTGRPPTQKELEQDFKIK
jgi:hypothetical protein